eukprot:3100947-Rhodomonas_salina.1
MHSRQAGELGRGRCARYLDYAVQPEPPVLDRLLCLLLCTPTKPISIWLPPIEFKTPNNYASETSPQIERPVPLKGLHFHKTKIDHCPRKWQHVRQKWRPTANHNRQTFPLNMAPNIMIFPQTQYKNPHQHRTRKKLFCICVQDMYTGAQKRPALQTSRLTSLHPSTPEP